jgi:hypothetical protein
MTTPNHKHKQPHRPDNPGHPGNAGIDVAGELRRLTARDRWLLDLLHEHQVLSTEQITALAFDTAHTARIRLNLLNRRGVLARFRDCVRPGSQSWRWTLGPLGATYLAARDGKPTPRPSAIRDRANRLAANPRLGHTLAVNQFFTDLAAHARTNPGARLSLWWSERTCVREVTGDLVRPDGHGVWTEHGATLSFWLEVDRNTEPRHRVLSKLDGYLRLHRATGLHHAVLIWLDGPGRETSLHRTLTTHPAITSGGLLVATATSDTDPAAPVWLPAAATRRVHLTDLPRAGQQRAA